MGFQSGINAALGSIAGAAFGIQKTLQQRQEEQMKKVKEQQEAKKTQKRNFMSYLSKQPIAGGGTVGELPTNIQKQIASQYSKSERKKLMDAMDAQKEKNK